MACGWIPAVINASFWEGVVPSTLKEAIVHPLLKRPSMGPTVLDNFYLVFSLSFSTTKGPKWSGFIRTLFSLGSRLGQSTETAVITFVDNFWRDQDRGGENILAPLNISVAFSTINHISSGLALMVGSGRYCVIVVLFSPPWLVSVMLVEEERLSSRLLQDLSILPLLFDIYMKSLREVICWYGVWYNQYIYLPLSRQVMLCRFWLSTWRL